MSNNTGYAAGKEQKNLETNKEKRGCQSQSRPT